MVLRLVGGARVTDARDGELRVLHAVALRRGSGWGLGLGLGVGLVLGLGLDLTLTSSPHSPSVRPSLPTMADLPGYGLGLGLGSGSGLRLWS